MIPISIIFAETITISILNIFAVYLVAFGYRMNWKNILRFIVFASVITAYLTYTFSTKLSLRIDDKIFITDGVSSLLTALLASLPVLFVLLYRFSIALSLGLALSSGLLTMFFVNLLKDIY